MNSLSETLDLVEKGYAGLRETARLVLAVAATTRLNRDQPLAVILVGGPSSGKTSLLMPLTKGSAGSCLQAGVIRIDDFTPASLVSHAAKIKPDDLAKIDLLPKLKDRCVVVKEMAPMFTGHEEDLMKKFGVLASVLDGEGHVTSSGTFGVRGYYDKILFSLLGAVTPDVLSQKVYNSLSAVGPRFCFWEMPTRKVDLSKWRGPTKGRREIEGAAIAAMISFLEGFYSEHSVGSVEREYFEVGEEAQRALSACAVLMALLRSKINYEKEMDGKFLTSTVSRESPERAYRYLEQVVFGSALIAGRKEVSSEDLRLALGLAISCAIPKTRAMARLFFEGEYPRTNHDLSAYLKMSEDTASKYVSQLELLEVVQKVNFDGTTEWDLTETFKFLRDLLRDDTPLSTDIAASPKAEPQSPEEFDFEGPFTR